MANSDQNAGQGKFNKDNSESQKRYFNNYYDTPINHTPSEVDAVIGYFRKRGFDEVAAINTATVLLQQADIDEVPVFELIDTLKGATEIQLSNIVAQILNLNRSKTSVLGYRSLNSDELFDQRNIINLSLIHI